MSKELVKYRIVEFKREFFLDFCKIGENSWKNHSVHKNIRQAKRAIKALKDFYSVIE